MPRPQRMDSGSGAGMTVIQRFHNGLSRLLAGEGSFEDSDVEVGGGGADNGVAALDEDEGQAGRGFAVLHDHLQVLSDDGDFLLAAIEVSAEAVGVKAFTGGQGGEFVVVADVDAVYEHGFEEGAVVGAKGVGALEGGALGGFEGGEAGGDVGLAGGPGLEGGVGFGFCGGGAGGAAVGCDEAGVGAAHEEGVALPPEVDPGAEPGFDLVQPHGRDVAPGSYVVGVDGDGEGGGHGFCVLCLVVGAWGL